MMGLAQRVDFGEVLLGQVRAVQAFHPQAHDAFDNWGRWSREQGGIRPVSAHPRYWAVGGGQDNQGFGDECVYVPEDYAQARISRTLSDHISRRELTGECGRARPDADPDEDIPVDILFAEKVDVLVHLQWFLMEWRRIVRTIYFWRLMGHQLAREAGTKPSDFVTHFEAAMHRIAMSLT